MLVIPQKFRHSSIYKYFLPKLLENYGSHLGSSNSHNVCFKITYKFRQTKKWSNTTIHGGNNIKVIFLFFSFFLTLHVNSEGIPKFPILIDITLSYKSLPPIGLYLLINL